MPPRQRKPAAARSEAAETPAEASGRVYTYVQTLHVPGGAPELAGPNTAAVMAALHAGYRPTGPAYVERTENVDGATHVVWAVPVEAA